MNPVNYDLVAPVYDRRYAANRFDGFRAALRAFIGDAPSVDVLEVGCGTGHWVQELTGRARCIAGLDPSRAMLSVAREAGKDALLIRGEAECLPCRDRSLDRVFTLNAIHHFHDRAAFVREVRRVLRPGGSVMIAGLDPHRGLDRWWVYDHFPSSLGADRARYPSAESIRAMLVANGFVGMETTIAQHIPAAVPFQQAQEMGLVDRRSTSQLMVIADDEYEAGLERLRRDQPVLRADLRLFATIGRLEPE